METTITMKKTLLKALSVAAVLAFLPIGADAEELPLQHLETEDLRLVYLQKEHEYLLPHLGRCFHNSLDFHKELFGYTPNERVTVLLQDFDDYGYAGATAIPVNYLTLGIEPFEYVYETSPTNERINWVMSHELLHVVALDQASPSDRRARSFFMGKVVPTDEQPLSMLYGYLTTPRRYAPRWYHEGLATFMETWMAGGIGRALGGYDEMVFRSMVADDDYFYDLVGLVSEGTTADFQVGVVAYLYGTRFVSYIANQYGPEKVVAWAKRDEGSRASFSGQFKHVFGSDLVEEWRHWIDWEHEWQRANLERVRKYPVTEFQPLSGRPLGSVSRAYYDPGSRKLLTAVNYPGEFAHIAAIDVDSWEIEKITEVATPALFYVSSVAYDESSGTLFYTTDNSREWRDLNAVNLETGHSELLLKDIRTGDLVFNRRDKSIWGVQHHNGLSRVVQIAPPYSDWDDITDVLILPYGKDLFDIDISPDGLHLTGAIIEVSGRQRLVRMEVDKLLEGDSSYEVLYEFADNSPANFVYSPDGQYLYGTSYYTGVSNVFRYDFESGEMEGITNALTGFFRPVPISDDSLIAFHYTSEGFIPVTLANQTIEDVHPIEFLGQAIVEKHPVVKDWNIGSPAEIDLEALTLKQGDYSGVRNLELTSGYPIIESYRGGTAVGMRFNFMEPVGLSGLDISASVSVDNDVPDDERAHLLVRYRHYPWEITGTLNRADFYDFFGPTKASRKGYSLAVALEKTLINDRPKYLDYKLRVAAYGDLDTLPDYQNVGTLIEDYQTFSARLGYHNRRKTIGALGTEKGVEWDLNFVDNFVSSEHLPRVWGDLAVGFLLPWEHSSIWLRPSAGHSFRGDRENEFANFFFGGFGNNYVDHGSVSRFHDYYSFPGIELNELPGRNYAKMLAEWKFPPKRFRSLGIPSAYVNWSQFTLFTSGIRTDLDDEMLRRTLRNVGAQLDLKVVLFTHLSATLSFGYAKAFESDRRDEDEFMVSLKIL